MSGNSGFNFGGLGSLVSGVGSLVNAFSNIGAAKRNYKRQRQLMQDQQGYNLENMSNQYGYTLDMFNRTNEYNTPENAVKRLRKAGLSPTLAYDGGTLSGMSHMGSTPSSSNPSIPSPQPDSWSSVGAAVSGVGESLARIKLLNEQAKGQAIENENKQDIIDSALDYQKALTALEEQGLVNKKQQEKINDQMIKANEIANEIADRTKDISVDTAFREYQKLVEEIRQIELTQGKTIAETKNVQEQFNNIVSDRLATDASAWLTRETAMKMSWSAKKEMVEFGILEDTKDDIVQMSHWNKDLLGINKGIQQFIADHQEKDWLRLNAKEYAELVEGVANTVFNGIETFFGHKVRTDGKVDKNEFQNFINNAIAKYMLSKFGN